MSDYSQFAQANPGTDYPAKDALLRAQLSLDSDKVDSGAVGHAFGYKRNTTAALNVGYYGGVIISGGVLTTIADGTVALTDATTNYVERTKAGVVSKNTVGFTAGSIPMFTAVTAAGAVTTVVDKRQRNVFGDLVAVGNLAVTGTGEFSDTVTVSSASTKGLVVNSTDGASLRGLVLKAAGTAQAGFEMLPNTGEIKIGAYQTTGDYYPVIYSDGVAALTFGIGAAPSATFSGNLTISKVTPDFLITDTQGGGVTWTIRQSHFVAGDLAILSAGSTRLSIGTTGAVTMHVYGAGTATFSATGLISSVSDENYKVKDGAPKDVISMLMALAPGYYFGKPEANMGEGRQLGFYAQNVRAAIGPEAAPDPQDGRPWGYFDRSVLAVNVSATQNHESRLAALEARQ